MAQLKTQGLTIGELAKAAHINVETIRYYQKRGLLPHIPPPESGYKRYSAQFVEQIAFIKSAQHMNFSLNEIKELLALSSTNALKMDKNHIRAVAQARLTQVQQTKAHLTMVEQTLQSWLNACQSSGANTPCPIIEGIKAV